MNRFFGSLYWKLSAIFLALLVVLGAWLFWGFSEMTLNAHDAMDQRIYAQAAEELARVLQPHLSPRIDHLALLEQLNRFNKLSPNCLAFVIDSRGHTKFPPQPPPGSQQAVDLLPIHRYLTAASLSEFPILGSNPITGDRGVPFAVTRVELAGQSGFVYVVPNIGFRKTYFRGVASYAGATDLGQRFIAGLAMTAVLGLIILLAVTRRFYRITAVVDQYRLGNFAPRINLAQSDEMGQLASSIDQMAGTIVSNLEQLAQKDELRRELVSNISHDLRGPLASIHGYAETLLSKAAAADAVPESDSITLRDKCVDGILTNTRFLSRLISELFELSKLEAQAITPLVQPFFLSQLLEDTIVTFQPLAEARGVSISAVGMHEIPPVEADEEMIRRVIFNLCDNAIRHTSSGGTVEISCDYRNGKVEVQIRDSGRGIPAADLERIFERFYRVDKDRSKQTGGAGLGLAIVKKIMDAHGAEIKVSSELGCGTAFTLYLPMAGAVPC